MKKRRHLSFSLHAESQANLNGVGAGLDSSAGKRFTSTQAGCQYVLAADRWGLLPVFPRPGGTNQNQSGPVAAAALLPTGRQIQMCIFVKILSSLKPLRTVTSCKFTPQAPAGHLYDGGDPSSSSAPSQKLDLTAVQLFFLLSSVEK